jgi:hypothetical protein
MATCRVRQHPKWAHPLWPVAPDGHFEDVAIGASLKIKNLLQILIFSQNFYYILIFINIFF